MYDVFHTVLKAVEYGVPQKRERVIIVRFRKDLSICFTFPEFPITDESNYVPLKEVIDDFVEEKYFFSQKAVDGMMRNRESMNKGRAQDVEQPCNTVGAHLAKVSLNSTDSVLFVDGRYRRFTYREVARIQSFPEEYILSESESAQYRALGNAIPPVMFWYVARTVCNELQIKESDFAIMDSITREHRSWNMAQIKGKDTKIEVMVR
ncbi:DNA cytosine methyltransferase [Hornefia butyriciproducens]|uniref:DNA cytosine methyltransferase n=1 Tax=Hornefia butyriciproducens TaxID=2652293 RepID=UPI002A9095A4|nr:DNA cytosine methyltransferase [Hornefia butyriciproducens]MDY5463314.1 DNA cytosine methyltransferase [Hornefia butyriciproducens]